METLQKCKRHELSPSSESSYESSSGSKNSSTASDSESNSYSNYDDTPYSNGSDLEPSAMSSSPEHVKVKHVKQKNVKKVKRMKHKKEHPKDACDTSDDEMDVTPKKRLKGKKLRRCPKVKKEVEKKELKKCGKKHEHSSNDEHKEPKHNEGGLDIGSIRTVTGGGHVSVDVNEWVKLMEYVQ